jgi:hypothetical protein
MSFSPAVLSGSKSSGLADSSEKTCFTFGSLLVPVHVDSRVENIKVEVS